MFCRLYRSGSNNTTRTVPSNSTRCRQKMRPCRTMTLWAWVDEKKVLRQGSGGVHEEERRTEGGGEEEGRWAEGETVVDWIILHHYLISSSCTRSEWKLPVLLARLIMDRYCIFTQPTNKKIQKKTSSKKNIIHITRCVLRRQSGVRSDGGLAQLALPTRLTKFDVSIHRKIKHDLSHNFPLHV